MESLRDSVQNGVLRPFAHIVSHAGQRSADNAVERRGDARIALLYACVVERGLGCVERGAGGREASYGLVQIAFAGGAGLCQRFDPVVVLSGGDHFRFGLPDCGRAAGRLRFVRLRLDHVQQLALADERAFLEMDAAEEAADPRLNRNVVASVSLSHETHRNRDVPGDDFGDRQAERRRRYAFFLTASPDHDSGDNRK